jgi:hypothetical protein
MYKNTLQTPTTTKLLISNSHITNTQKPYFTPVNIVPKKRRVSIWLLPIIAIIGVIGYLTSVLGKPKLIERKQPLRIKKISNSTYNLEMHIVSDIDQLQVTST